MKPEGTSGPQLAEFATRWVDAASSVGAIDLVLEELVRRGILAPNTTSSCRGRTEVRNWHEGKQAHGESLGLIKSPNGEDSNGELSSAARKANEKVQSLRRKMRRTRLLSKHG